MELMTNLSDITEILAEDSKEKEFHMILRKEQQLKGSLNLERGKIRFVFTMFCVRNKYVSLYSKMI